MKKNLVVFLFLLFAVPAFAQYENQETEVLKTRNVLKYNFFGVFNKSFTLEYERVLNKKFSFQIAVGYRSSNLDWQVALTDSLVNTKYFDIIQRGFTFVPELKFYWTHFSRKMTNPTGAYFAPFMRVGYYDMLYKDYFYNAYDAQYNLTEIGGGTVMGFQVLAGGSFAVDVFLGPQVKYSHISEIRWDNLIPPPGYTNDPANNKTSDFRVGLRAGITIGFAF
jgi:hypothetical protein